jgi:8-oxo-dGTP pyrophosphatase MutT (NUDIX family)
MENYFIGTPEHPYHLSAGAVVINEEDKVCCHHYEPGNDHPFGEESLYVLMRESLEPNERLEDAVARGLMEEFGITATIKGFLGSIQSEFEREEATIQKTTLYFLCSLVSQDLAKRNDDLENRSKVEWKEVSFLIDAMPRQSRRTDLNESAVLQRYLNTKSLS